MNRILKVICWIAILSLFSACSSYKPIPPAPLTKFTPTLRVVKAWKNGSSYGTSNEYLRLTPVISNQTIFVASYLGYVTAVNANTGSKIWKVNAKVPITTGLAASNDKIFFGTSNGVILALNQKDGKVVWWHWLPSEALAAPTVVAKTLLVKTEDGTLSAYSTQNGNLLWKTFHKSPSLILRGASSSQVFGNKIVVGYPDGKLMALNLRNGAILWQKQIAIGKGDTIVQQMVDIDVTPQVSNGVVYVATYQGRVAAVRLRSGQLLWQHQLSSYTGIALGGGKIYVTDAAGTVWAFNKKGDVAWRQNALAHRGLTAPAVIGNYVVVADSAGYVHFLAQTDGRFVARTKVDRYGVSATPVVDGNSVYIYGNIGNLVKLTI